VRNARAVAWGLPRERLYMLLAEEEDILIDLSGQKYQELLAQMVYRLEPALVIVDSLGAVMGKGENAVEDVRGVGADDRANGSEGGPERAAQAPGDQV
jgi:hypothetical protein